MSLIIRDCRVLTMDDGSAPGSARRGDAMRDLGVIDRADVVIEGE